MDTPREVMFSQINSLWGASNKELARAIVRHDSATSGKSPLELIEVRSSLSRFVVHVAPGENIYGWIAPYDQAVPRVMSLIKASNRPHESSFILDVMTGSCARAMRVALDQNGSDGALFTNVARQIRSGENCNVADAAEVALALFVVAGCEGSAQEAARYAIKRMQQLAMAAELRTQTAFADTTSTGTMSNTRLGLYRLSQGRLVGAPYALSEDQAGTEIGAMSFAVHSITDVSRGVSRRHARIWRDQTGMWWIEDLGSTNGTEVVRSTGERVVVSGARRQSTRVPPYVPLVAGDRIVLAGKTEFGVVELAAEPTPLA